MKKLIGERNEFLTDITKDMEEFRFYMASEKIYHYIWHTLADIILEDSKKIFQAGTDDEKNFSKTIPARHNAVLLENSPSVYAVCDGGDLADDRIWKRAFDDRIVAYRTIICCTIFISITIAFFGGFLPSIVWLIFWNEEKKKAEPKRALVLAFLGGMAAVFLSLLFEKIMYNTSPDTLFSGEYVPIAPRVV